MEGEREIQPLRRGSHPFQLRGYQGLAARRGILSLKDGEACGVAGEGVWVECSARALFGWVVAMPCYLPMVVFFLPLVHRWSFCLLVPLMERVGWP